MVSSSQELKVHRYLDKATRGLVGMSDDTIEQVVSYIREALQKQFSPREDKFRLRMSNIGRPYCQLWFMKNKPETRVHPPANRVMIMMLGDIVEAVFKGISIINLPNKGRFKAISYKLLSFVVIGIVH